MTPSKRNYIKCAMACLEDMPCGKGGVGPDGPSEKILALAELWGGYVDDDPDYHQAQRAWRYLEEALTQ